MRPRRPHPPATQQPHRGGWKRKAAGRPPFRGTARASGDGAVILYGWHTVKAALENPARRIRRLYATANAARRLAEDGVALAVEPELVRPDAIARRLGPDAVHNGLLAEADPLPSPELEEIEPAGIVLVLDQITDPHNVGAILRTAAGFAVDAVITTARHSPEATGVLAKSASGALEYVPIVTVQNLARALATLRERGYFLVGLDSTGDADLGDGWNLRRRSHPRGSGHAERAQLSGSHQRKTRGHDRERAVDAARDHVGEGRRCPTVGHMGQIDFGEIFEQLAAHMRGAAVSG